MSSCSACGGAVVFLSDEWREPSVCLALEGAMPGNDVCADIRHGSFNGMYGNGSRAYPFPLVPVKQARRCDATCRTDCRHLPRQRRHLRRRLPRAERAVAAPPRRQGKCYRMRWILAGSNTENFQITVTGHNMTLVSVDGGYDVE